LKVDDPARRLQAYLSDSEGAFGPDLWTGPANELADNGVLTITYNSESQSLALAFANGIVAGPSLVYMTQPIEDWGIGIDDILSFELLGTTAATTVSPGQAYFDNVTLIPLLSGDLNIDGFVGQDDLNIVLSNWGQTVMASQWGLGDPSGDGFVGQDDLNDVLAGWGQGAAAVVSSYKSVAEPTSMLMLTMAGIGFVVYRRTSRHPGRRKCGTA
jgi:hypothetical protein